MSSATRQPTTKHDKVASGPYLSTHFVRVSITKVNDSYTLK
jgi:hypothetical protein